MACGVPVVAYRRGGPGELIQPGLNGWLVEPDQPRALAEALERVDQIDRRQCRQWVEGQASRAVLAERLEQWLEAGLMGKGR
jgi:UDP-glucose:tetrahydrobiopterin glucosyltransferase